MASTGPGFYRGTTHEQTPFFCDKEKKMIGERTWPSCFDRKVDFQKVSLDVVKTWITRNVTLILGHEDDIVIDYVMQQLLQQPSQEERGNLDDADQSSGVVDPRKLTVNLTGFMADKAASFVADLWSLLLSAQESEEGIPREFAEAQELERQLKLKEAERIKVELEKLAAQQGGDHGPADSSDGMSKGFDRHRSRGRRSRSSSPRRWHHHRASPHGSSNRRRSPAGSLGRRRGWNRPPYGDFRRDESRRFSISPRRSGRSPSPNNSRAAYGGRRRRDSPSPSLRPSSAHRRVGPSPYKRRRRTSYERRESSPPPSRHHRRDSSSSAGGSRPPASPHSVAVSVPSKAPSVSPPRRRHRPESPIPPKHHRAASPADLRPRRHDQYRSSLSPQIRRYSPYRRRPSNDRRRPIEHRRRPSDERIDDRRRLSHDRRRSSDDRRCPSEDRRRPSEDRRRPSEDRRRPSEDRRRPSEDRRRPSEDRRRPSEDRRRPSEDRRRPSEDRRRLSEDRRRLSEDRRRPSEDRRRRSENRRRPSENRRRPSEERQRLSDERRRVSDDRRRASEDRPRSSDDRRLSGDRRWPSEDRRRPSKDRRRLSEDDRVPLEDRLRASDDRRRPFDDRRRLSDDRVRPSEDRSRLSEGHRRMSMDHWRVADDCRRVSDDRRLHYPPKVLRPPFNQKRRRRSPSAGEGGDFAQSGLKEPSPTPSKRTFERKCYMDEEGSRWETLERTQRGEDEDDYDEEVNEDRPRSRVQNPSKSPQRENARKRPSRSSEPSAEDEPLPSSRKSSPSPQSQRKVEAHSSEVVGGKRTISEERLRALALRKVRRLRSRSPN